MSSCITGNNSISVSLQKFSDWHQQHHCRRNAKCKLCHSQVRVKKDCWWQLMLLSLVWRRFIHRHSQCHCCCYLQLAEFPLTADYYSLQHWNHHISRLVASDNRKQVSLQLHSQDDCAFCCECSHKFEKMCSVEAELAGADRRRMAS